MCVILQIFYCCRAADAPSLLTPDVIGAPRQTAAAVVQPTAFAQRHRSRRVSSPHAIWSLRERIRRGQPRQQAAVPYPTLQDAGGQPWKAGNATVIGRTSSRRMAPDRENSMPCCTHRHGMRFTHRYASIKIVLLNARQAQPADASAAAGRSDRAIHSVGHWWCGWQLTDDARQAGSHSVAGQGIDTGRSVDASFHMGSGYSPGDGPIIALAGERTVLYHSCLEGRCRIAGDVGVRHRIAEPAVRHRDDRLARRYAPKRIPELPRPRT